MTAPPDAACRYCPWNPCDTCTYQGEIDPTTQPPTYSTPPRNTRPPIATHNPRNRCGSLPLYPYDEETP